MTQDIVYSGYDFGQRHADHHEDLPRDREGGLDAQIFSIWVDPLQFPKERWFAEAEHQMLALSEKLPKAGVPIVRTAREIRENKAKNMMSALFGVEGGHELWPGTPDEQLAHLRRFAELGARYMTLTWSNSNDVGGSSRDPFVLVRRAVGHEQDVRAAGVDALDNRVLFVWGGASAVHADDLQVGMACAQHVRRLLRDSRRSARQI